TELPTSRVDLHSVAALAERKSHGWRRPPDIRTLREFAVESNDRNEQQASAQKRIEEPETRWHRILLVARSSLLPNGSRLSCGALKKDSLLNLRAPPSFKRLLGSAHSEQSAIEISKRQNNDADHYAKNRTPGPGAQGH